MWLGSYSYTGGNCRFFRVGFCHDNLKAHFELNFSLLHHHKMDFTIFDDMMPWERDAYIAMLVAKIEEENERIKLENAAIRAANLSKQRPVRRR
jgi:hypothetical protein